MFYLLISYFSLQVSRLEILNILSGSLPLADDVDLPQRPKIPPSFLQSFTQGHTYHAAGQLSRPLLDPSPLFLRGLSHNKTLTCMLNPILLLSWYLLLRGQEITSLLWVLPLNSNLKEKKKSLRIHREQIYVLSNLKKQQLCVSF